ncbi:MAG: hypothetical protein J6D52_10795, partial [Clostridia bacterium]|nr:hypothetical protein [Clostridia bacterium]
MLKSIVTAARDYDGDKTYLEKYFGELFQNINEDINPLGMIPFVKDILSIFEGYSVERADMSLFSDLYDAINILQNDNKTVDEKLEKIAGSLAAFLGLPVKNILRDMRAAYNLAMDFKRDVVDDSV